MRVIVVSFIAFFLIIVSVASVYHAQNSIYLTDNSEKTVPEVTGVGLREGNKNSYSSFRVYSGDVINIVNLTSDGWTWRYTDSFDVLTSLNIGEPRVTAVTRRPGADFIIDVVVVTYSTYQVELTKYVNYTFLYFMMDYSNSTVDKDKVTPSIQLVDWFSVVEDASEAPRITRVAISWIDSDNLTLVYALEERTYNATYNFYRNNYTIYMKFWSSLGWTSERVILGPTDGSVSFILPHCNATNYLKYVSIGTLDITVTVKGSLIVFEKYAIVRICNPFTGSVLDTYQEITRSVEDFSCVTPLYYSDEVYFVAAVVYGPGDSELLLFHFNGATTTSSLIIDSREFAAEYGVYPSYVDPSSVIFYDESSLSHLILVVLLAHTDIEDYLTYLICDFSGTLISDILILRNIIMPSNMRVLNTNIDDENASLLLIDSSAGVPEVIEIYGYWNSTVQEWIWVSKTFATETHTQTIRFDAAINDLRDIFIVHISYTAEGNKTVYPVIGYFDVDRDYLGNWEEVNVYATFVDDPDSDADGICDGSEIFLYATDPLDNDTDDDHLSDKFEIEVNPAKNNVYQTDPLSPDTDADGLSDYEEVYGEFYNKTRIWGYSTDPLNNDTDGDGLSDYEEIIIGVTYWINDTALTYVAYPSALSSDTDNDLLSDYEEKSYGTNPNSNDTDNDQLSEYDEIVFYGTYPQITDSDYDGLSDYEEIMIYYTDPLDWDSDGDAINDSAEIKIYGTDPTNYDSDGDGLGDYDEIIVFGTNPLSEDSDNDRIDDFTEIYEGFNATNSDTDNDGLTDGQEYFGVNITGIGIRFLDPTSNDTDGDSLTDYEEAMELFTDPTESDTDGDGLSDYEELRVYSTSPLNEDSDEDALSDYEEVRVYGTNPLSNDTDADSLSDWDEVKRYITNPLSNDTDSDNLTDFVEVRIYDTNPITNDTDGDGLSDYEELKVYSTDPRKRDTDGDGVDDYLEVIRYRSDPNNKDTDDDGLEDDFEVFKIGTLPTNNDTDGDGLLDGEEVFGFRVAGYGFRTTNPLDNDTDGDGLTDYEEVRIHGTDPTLFDTDNDGLNDYEERILYQTNATSADSDNDGLSDYEEVKVFGTDAWSVDSDGDGLTDYVEVKVLKIDPLSTDSDKDLIPDNLDIIFPHFKDEIIYLLVGVVSLFAYAFHYGAFRNPFKDIITVGLSDEGGTLMLLIPEEIKEKQDPNLISPALIGIHQLTSEITGEQRTIVLSGRIATIIRHGEASYMWVFAKKSYPKIVKTINKLHSEIEKRFKDVLTAWSGDVDELADVRQWLIRVLGAEEIKEVAIKTIEELKEVEPEGAKGEIEIEEEKELSDEYS